MDKNLQIRELIVRLARLDMAQAWHGDLNPTQSAVLDYLARANRFSRSPSHVSQYLGSTRGTVSQSLKSLGQKGYVTERKSQSDKRTISFDLTAKGHDAAQMPDIMTDHLTKMDRGARDRLLETLRALLIPLLADNDGKPFGVCKTCRHFAPRDTGGYCGLLSADLSHEDTSHICHEQVSA